MKKLMSILTAAAAMLTMNIPAAVHAYENGGNTKAKPKRTYETPEELMALLVDSDESFPGGGIIYSDKYSFDAKLNAGAYAKNDYLIVYGLGSDMTIYDLILNVDEYADDIADRDPSIYSGFTIQIKNDKIASPDNNVYMVFFTANTLPGKTGGTDLVSACESYGFDIAPYIYDELTPGDINCDGAIDAVDASMVLYGYSRLSINDDLQLSSTLFDYNGDGMIDAVDASMILTYYAKQSVTAG